MSEKLNRKFLYSGIAIALLISVLAPFLASSNPDGLESAAAGVVEKSKLSGLEETEPVVDSPMPDYSIEGMGKTGESSSDSSRNTCSNGNQFRIWQGI